MLRLLLFVLPLGLDTFAVSAALGASGAQKRERLRIALLLSVFEMAMPVVGLLLGRGLGSAVGNVADYVAIIVLGAVGLWMLTAEEEGEIDHVAQLSQRRGLALLALGLRTCLIWVHVVAGVLQGRWPGPGASRRVMTPIIAHLTIASEVAGRRS